MSRRNMLTALAAAMAGVAAFGAKALAPLRGGALGVAAREEGGGRRRTTASRRPGPAPGTVKRRG